MFACFGRGKCKKSPSPVKPNLPANMLRYIARTASPQTRRAMSRATTPYTRRTLPIGLQVTKVGPPIVPRNRPPVVNRSRAVAKTPKITRGSSNSIDRIVPQAYKNNRWQYYSSVRRHIVLFLNTPKGAAYTFNKQGQRVNVTNAFLAKHGLADNWRRVSLKQRRKNYHTWDAYQKRLMKFRGGKGSILPRLLADIDAKVQRFIHGDRHALDDVPYSRLVLWANLNRRMSSNGTPYVKNASTGKWRRYGSGQDLTKNMILNNINLTYIG
jgi:hypothetical protein